MADPKKDTKQPPTPEQPPKGRRRVKKSKGHGGHHGGAWKVAYADFVTAMMALFLVLWLVSQADTKLKEAIASYFRSPGVFNTMNGGILSGAKKVSKEPTSATSKDDEQALFNVAENIQKKFSTRPEFSKVKDQVKVDVTEEGLRIQIIDKADKVSFSSGSAELNPEASAILTEIANGICGLPNKINIGGHTDSYVFPAAKGGYTNWELSADRANAARRVLQAVCVKPEQIRRIVGYADTEPMVPNDPFAPANRRISITVLRQSVALGEKNSDSRDAEEEKSVIENDEKKLKDSRKAISETPKPSAKSKANEDSEKDAETSEESTEKKTAKAKLKNEGAVSVGEPDIVPNKPQVKEAKKAEN
jgi:chemotaxis protein MotB